MEIFFSSWSKIDCSCFIYENKVITLSIPYDLTKENDSSTVNKSIFCNNTICVSDPFTKNRVGIRGRLYSYIC
ncbi:hypothetical protein FG135_09080 [Vibrio cholerae]|nr:hypothetical protein F0H41_02040 [Vibrio cholerae]KAA1008640.1 hypothetical protein F0H40_08335 [Vibrio cholerae]KAA1017266.1 hypothetical protein F0H43_08330 [Vibrio cholerae]KAA1023760.1 hypothetical protein F0H42_02040 [Vibrio cholerae]KAA1027528.1 hypothetical protein F0H44_05200 [Vibrio cholerae]